MFRFVVTFLFLIASNVARCEKIELSPTADWFAVLSGDQLKPGDEVVLHAGTYSSPRRLAIRSSGTVQKPIVI